MAAQLIRPAEDRDLPRILELYRGIVSRPSEVERKIVASAERFEQTFNAIRDLTGYDLLVLEDQGKVVGVMSLLIMPNLTHQASPWARIENLVVDAEYRQRGFGGQLIKHAIAQARAAGCYTLVLSSDVNNQSAHRFYESLGFVSSAVGFSLRF